MARLEQPSWGLPALFAVEYALARQWMAWGVKPDALIGHSMGEYTAACLAGVMSLEDALAVVLLRGRLFETLAPGEMVGVPLSEAEVLPLLGPGLAIAAVNAPSSCVVSGPPEALAAFAAAMEEDGVECRRLHIAVAAHSPMVEPILREFEQFFHGITLQPPAIPVVSNVTGAWLTADEACSPEYWARHLRQTVRFFDGLGLLLREPNRVLLEVRARTDAVGIRAAASGEDRRAALAGFAASPEGCDAGHRVFAAGGRPPVDGRRADRLDGVHRRPGTPPRRAAAVCLRSEALSDRAVAVDRGHAAAPAPCRSRHSRRSGALRDSKRACRRAAVVSEAAPPTQARTIVMSHQSNHSRSYYLRPPVAVRSRADRICDRLTELLHKLSGLPASEIDPNVSFLEMGFDSLFLTQASLRFKNEFKVRIGFRQLFEDAPTLSALARVHRRQAFTGCVPRARRRACRRCAGARRRTGCRAAPAAAPRACAAPPAVLRAGAAGAGCHAAVPAAVPVRGDGAAAGRRGGADHPVSAPVDGRAVAPARRSARDADGRARVAGAGRDGSPGGHAGASTGSGAAGRPFRQPRPPLRRCRPLAAPAAAARAAPTIRLPPVR